MMINKNKNLGWEYRVTEEFVHGLTMKYADIPKTKIGTTFESIVSELLLEIKERTKLKITKLNGAGSKVYDSSNPMFDESVKMVAEDIAIAIVHKNEMLAIRCLDDAPRDVLAQQAHLSLDF